MHYAGYIDNAFVSGEGAELIVENPSDASVIARLAGLSRAQMEAAIAAARRAFDLAAWSGLSVRQRGEVMRRFMDALEAAAPAITDVVVAETGCPLHSGSIAAQVRTPFRMGRECIELFESLPEFEENALPLHERVNGFGQAVQSLRRYTPAGVVVAVAAYNFPLHTAMWKIMPALLAGNSVILRPNPLTPLSALALAQCAQEAGLPRGVFNVVLESGVEGAQTLTSHPAVDLVTFTGSTQVGAQVAVQAAPTFKRVQLELGGKSAQIFLPDSADRVAAAAASIATAHAGQGCVLGTRIFVPQEQKDELVRQAAAAVSQLRVGHSLDPQTQVGPVISAAQVARCEHFVKLAVEHGGRIAAGGSRPAHLDKGHFFAPTVLDLPDNSNPAAQEEIFGPVASIIGYRDLDHAVEMANDSKYGLSGYVFGKDQKRALDVALRVKSGSVHINGALSSTYAPFGGIKASGLGKERGVEGMRFFQTQSCLTIAR